MKQLYSIQYLRAVAAMLVVYCHSIDLQMNFGTSVQQNFYYLQNFGAFGVDIFFVISGFIMAYISKSESGLSESVLFIKKRFIRINPTYYLVSLGMLLLVMLGGLGSGLPTKLIVKTITILPIIDYGKHFWSPLLYIGWTLSFEWFFYLLLGLLIAFSIMKYRNLYLIGMIVGLVLLGVILPINEVHWNFATNPMLLEFGLGLLVAIIFMKEFELPRWAPLALISMATVSIVYLIFYGYGDISEASLILDGGLGLKRIVLWGIPATFLVIGAILMERKLNSQFHKSPLLLLLGDASYAIYLIHPICFILISTHVKQLEIIKLINPDILIFIFVIVAALAGILFHLMVEKRLIKALNKILLKQKYSFSGSSPDLITKK